jgi:hypothetical protein
MDSPLTNTPASAPTQASASQHGTGPLIGTGIIIVLIICGGLYAWHMYLTTSQMEQNTLPLILGDDREGLPPTSSSDSVSEIEADIEATDLDALDAQVEADLQAVESTL